MTGDTANAIYRMQLHSLVLFAYGLIFKAFLIGSVVSFDCRGVERFWLGSGLFWGFSVVLVLLTTLSALPWWQQGVGRRSSRAERRWLLVAPAFTLYMSSWLLLLYAFLRPGSLVGRTVAMAFGFERGNWCT